MQKIVTNLWFDGRVEEAVQFYTSIFADSQLKTILRYGDAGPRPKGDILTATFDLEGQEFTSINGGPEFTLSPAMSLLVKCQDQSEIDYFWERLSEGGEKGVCGWLTDPFGVSWQVIPTVLDEMLQDQDEAKTQRVTEAFLAMKKMDIAELERAYAGG